VFVTSPLSPQEASPLGFAPEQVLALADGEHRAAFEWQQAPGVNYGPESGAGEVTVGVTATGAAQFARVQASKRGAQCDDHVLFPLRVTLSTAGGALDESFAARLRATNADEAALGEVLPAAQLHGAFAFSEETLGNGRFIRLEVNLRFGAAAFAGSVLGGIENGDAASGTTSFRPVPLACWGQSASLTPACAD